MRRDLWVATALVLGPVVVLALAIWIPSGPGGTSTAPSSSVVTAPSATAPPVEVGKPRDLRGTLQPAEVASDELCSLHSLHSPRSLHGARILRVLQFNIHFGVSRGGLIDLAGIAAEIEAVRPDLVSLNEVDSGTARTGRIDEARYLAGATGLEAVYGPNLPWEGGRFGNAVLSRYPVVASRNLRLPGVPGLEPRGLLTATVRVGHRPLSFSSMHLSDGPDGRRSRILQAQAVATALQHVSHPTILAGDLNSQPRGLPVRILRQYFLDAQGQGGTGRGDTIPEPAPHSRFDYVLYDHHLAVMPGSTRVLPSSSSDHRSVLTELALLPKRRC